MECRWNIPGTMPQLAQLDVANNNLSGTVPSGWGSAQSQFVTKGESAKYMS